METCPKCGGTIIGDGYTSVRHCEFADDDKIFESEPDAPVILCDFQDQCEKIEER